MTLYNYDGVFYNTHKPDMTGRCATVECKTILDPSIDIEEDSTPLPLCPYMEAEYKGKLGVLTDCNDGQIGSMSCNEADFKYDTLQFFHDTETYTVFCYIGACKGRYNCIQINYDQDLKVISQTLIVTNDYDECLNTPLKGDSRGRRVGDLEIDCCLSASIIDNVALGQVLVVGSNHEYQTQTGMSAHSQNPFGAMTWLVGENYTIPTMDGRLSTIKTEMKKLATYAKDHPETQFILSSFACCALGVGYGDLGPLLNDVQEANNIFLPIEWVSYFIDDESFSTEMERLLSSNGRAALDEWTGRLAVLYAAHAQVPLTIGASSLEIQDADRADKTITDITRLVNSQELPSSSFSELKDLQETISNITYEEYEDWYKYELKSILKKECHDVPDSDLLASNDTIRWIFTHFLNESGCTRVYNPFAGLCGLADSDIIESDTDIKYVCQEPSHNLAIIAQLLGEECRIGDFINDWIGDDCDGLACILPSWNGIGKESGQSRYRARRITKHLLHNLTLPGSMKAAVVIVDKDVLTCEEYQPFRRSFIKQRHLARVIPISDTEQVLLYLDFTKTYDSVRMAASGYVNLVRNMAVEMPFDAFVENLSEFEKSVPYEYITSNDYNLSYHIYSIPPVNTIPEEDKDEQLNDLIFQCGDTDRQLYYEDDFNYVKITDLLEEAKPVKQKDIPSDTLTAYGPDFSYDRRVIAYGGRRTLKNNGLPSNHIYEGPCIAVSQWGLFYCNEEQLFTTFYFVKVFHIDTAKINPQYLIAMLTDRVNLKEVIPFFENWRVPVLKGGPEAQKRFVDEHFPELADKEMKQYNVVTVGDEQLRQMPWNERGINVIGHCMSIEELRMNLDNDSIRRVLDGIVIDASLDYIEYRCEGVQELSYMNTGVPYYIISNGIDKQAILNSVSRKLREDVGTRIYDGNDSHSATRDIRKDLQKRHTPEFLVRNEYKEQLDCAKIIDAKWPELKGVEEFLLEFLSECKKDGSRFPEKSFTNLRTIRDQILYQLSRVGAIPPLNDEGAMAALLADRIYTDDKTVYYQLKGHMPHVLAEGVRFIGNISNEAIHESEGNKELAMSLTHILLSLINWTAQHIKEGFFERSHSGSWIKAVDFKNEHEVKSGDEYKVNNTLRNGKPYWYCKNIHIGGDDAKRLQPGKTLKIGKVSNEKQPFITDDVQCIFYCEDWTLVD